MRLGWDRCSENEPPTYPVFLVLTRVRNDGGALTYYFWSDYFFKPSSRTVQQSLCCVCRNPDPFAFINIIIMHLNMRVHLFPGFPVFEPRCLKPTKMDPVQPVQPTQKPNYRYNVRYKLPEVSNLELLGLVKLSTTENLVKFKERYGNVLTFLEAPLNSYQTEVVTALFQFYDRALRSFVFPDFVLAPTLEEYSEFLNIPILHQIPFHVDK